MFYQNGLPSFMIPNFNGTCCTDIPTFNIPYGGFNAGNSFPLFNVGAFPVTFGQMDTNDALPEHAYGRPEAGVQGASDYGSGWDEIAPNAGFAQYEIELRALKADKTSDGNPSAGIDPGYALAAKDVYLSDIVIEGVSSGSAIADNLIADAVRIHLAVSNGKNFIISKTAVTDMELSGPLDLNGDGQPDTYDVYEWGTQEVVQYGVAGQKQTTRGISDIKNTRSDDGTMPTVANKLICTTSTGAEMIKITVTIWLEGWAALKNSTAANADPSAVWNPKMNSGVDVRVGMTFDAGRNING